MSINLIAIIKDSKDNILGYRFIDEKEKVYDLQKDSLSHKFQRIDIYKYPVIVNNSAVGVKPTVILKEYIYNSKIEGYQICDWDGFTHWVTREFVASYINKYGLANGTINKDKEISLIEGTYEREIVENTRENIFIYPNDLKVSIVDSMAYDMHRLDTPYGYVAGYYEGNKFRLDHLEIKKEYRNKGAGTQLYKYLEQYLRHYNIAKKVELLTYNMVQTLFWQHNSFKIMEYTMDDEELPEKALMHKQL